ncbi:nicotinate-nicotinamide nucleotide adenylyltransferase [Grimontia marina]|uniref:nicotinate-nucleotide adenylyltransferase n=1 Tax=Grimontia marina TaxID=646534 RepID=A0A128F2M2_9GAMM|nr:nicotinate-nicotinamide nucleotide adenylyltransferase [Grimontia marina]CZF81048.1 putative nicotinate-nucleotide adenylyltransferase [Grimontia marina]
MSKVELRQNIAIFGSAFNPPSLGHLSVIQRLSHFDRVLLVPSYAHAWGKQMADFSKRCEWVSDFIDESNCDNLTLYREEETLCAEESVTTWALLNHIQQQHPNSDLTFVLGPDNLLNFSKFHKSAEILQRWNVLACPESLSVRSTTIRERLLAGESIDDLTTPALANKLRSEDFSQL